MSVFTPSGQQFAVWDVIAYRLHFQRGWVLGVEAALCTQSVPCVSEHKDSCCGGEHHPNVPEDPTEADQTSCSHQQKEQGKSDWFDFVEVRNNCNLVSSHAYPQLMLCVFSCPKGCCCWVPDYSQALQQWNPCPGPTLAQEGPQSILWGLEKVSPRKM